MKAKFFFISFFLLIALQVKAELRYLKLGSGKVIAYEWIKQSNHGKTLLLLPGVNRSLSGTDRSVKILIDKGWNVLMPSLPAHPLSIAGLKATETPYFLYDKQIRVQNFAEDLQILIQKLEIKDVIPVSLSYSSALGIYLDQKFFSHIIQTVPMTQPNETDPEAVKRAKEWESWLQLNPFLAPFWIRQARDTAYFVHWDKIVDRNLQQDPKFYGESPRVLDIKNGYVTIARAAEDFDFMSWDFSKDLRTHDFVIAENENPERLQNQKIVIQNYLKWGRALRVVVVSRSGHILPTERPEVYAEVVALLASQPKTAHVQFALVESQENMATLQWQGLGALVNWLQRP